jgi:histidine triad (HIT) family protein
MNDCIFCKIINGEIPSHKVYEDEDCVAFLDVMPRSKGMCLVVPKKHYNSFDDDFDTSSRVFDAALIVGEKIKRSLEPLAVFFSVIQAQVPHFHVRVYPVYKDQIPLGENQPIETNEGELNELEGKIKSVEVDWKPEQKVVEVIKEVKVPVERKPESQQKPQQTETKTEETEKPKEEPEEKPWKRRSEMEVA